MKNIKILLALLAIVSLSIACTTDDNSGSGSGSSKARVVSKIIFEYDIGVREVAFKYDSDGRITRVTRTQTESEFYGESYYNYGSDNELEIVEEWGSVYGDDNSRTLALLNNKGYMTRIDDSMTLSYDSKGYLVSISESDEDWWDEISYLWSGGNIVEAEYMSEEDGNSITFDYNNKPMSMVNLDLNLVLSNWRSKVLYFPYSYGDGLTGRKSKNFMTGWTVECDGYEEETTISWSYDEDGYPKEALVEYEDGTEFCMTIKYKN
ncbi:MAG: DUF4595 domain-containing protein [Alistipes sp.]|nr:DUF4595 domain-containing protein [Alistipes sp.]